MTIRGILILFLCILLFPTVFGEELYVDATMVVSESGEVIVTSVTNSPLFVDQTTHEFTSKDGTIWSLNISDAQLYVDMYYEISLPQNAEINYLQSSVSSRFYVEDGIPKVKGFGSNDTFEVFVQYELGESVKESLSIGIIVAVVLVLSMLVFLVIFFSKQHAPEKKPTTSSANKSQSNAQLSQSTLHLEERQQDIMQLLQRRGKLTQKQLSDYLSLPKSSVFRNIRSLEQKGLVQKERMGMSTIISLTVSKSDEKQ